QRPVVDDVRQSESVDLDVAAALVTALQLLGQALVGFERHDLRARLDHLHRLDALTLVRADIDVNAGQGVRNELEREELGLVRDRAKTPALIVESIASLLQEIEVALDRTDQLAY